MTESSKRERSFFLGGLAAGLVVGAMLTLVAAATVSSQRKGVATIDTNELGLIVENKLDHVFVDDLAGWIIEGRKDFVVVDIRKPDEYAAYHIPGAVNVPLTQLGRSDITAQPKIVLYSSGGIHASQAWFFLKALGHKGSYTLFGGLEEWRDAYVEPVAPEAPSAADKALYDRRVAIAAALARMGR